MDQSSEYARKSEEQALAAKESADEAKKTVENLNQLVDQTYKPTSPNAQSGIAVAEAVNPINEKLDNSFSKVTEESIVEETSDNLINNYEKQSKIISASGTKLNYYDNDTYYTIIVPLNEYQKYVLKSSQTTGVNARRAILDSSQNYIQGTYISGNVHDELFEYSVSDGAYLVICAEISAFEKLVLQGTSTITESKEILIPKDYVATIKGIFQSPLNTVKGKKVSILGDSITYGYATTKKWWQYVTERYGIQEPQVNAEIGRAFARNGSSSTRFTEKVTELDTDSDIYIVFGGVNDFQFSTPIGTIDDEPTNANGAETSGVTFYASVKYVIEYLITNYPNSKIIFFTSLPKNDKEIFNPTNTAGHKLNDYVEAITMVSRAYGVDLVDLNSVGEFYVHNTNWLAENMPDGIHPNDKGTETYVKNGIFPALDRLFIKY
jgi:lysophospholipase L1-like esterase